MTTQQQTQIDWRRVAYRLAYSPGDPTWPVLLDHWVQDTKPLPVWVIDPPPVDVYTTHSFYRGSDYDVHTVKICYGLEEFYKFTLESVDVYYGRIDTKIVISGEAIPQRIQIRGEWFAEESLSIGNPAIARAIYAVDNWLQRGEYND